MPEESRCVASVDLDVDPLATGILICTNKRSVECLCDMRRGNRYALGLHVLGEHYVSSSAA